MGDVATWIASIVGLIVALATLVNAYYAQRVRAEILSIRIWCLETFVTKDELGAYNAAYNRHIAQLKKARRG
jgi:hypothetical protein